MTALDTALREFQSLLTDVRRAEERTGQAILATLAAPPIDPDDDTLDTDDDSLPPPLPRHRTEKHQ
jgi:hypothetical protein